MSANLDHCIALVRAADHDRYIATLFSPAEHRDALYALYAFNVEIARVRDVARQPMPGEIRLQWWREALAGERPGEASGHPVAAALGEAFSRYGLSTARLDPLIDAHSFDLYEEPLATLDDLDRYARDTQAVLIGSAAAILRSADGAAAEALIRHASLAYTITGILSQIGRHAARRQLYLPQEVLDRHHLDPTDIFASQDSAGLQAALAELRRHARRHLAAAGEQLDFVPPAILPALLPLATVGAALDAMERRGYQPFRFEPPSRLRRQWLLWRAARKPRRIFM